MHNVVNIESLCELVHNQVDRPQRHHSARQVAREAHISRSSVHKIIKNDLQIELNFMLSFCLLTVLCDKKK